MRITIGEGEFSKVYHDSDRNSAIKVLKSDEYISDLLREANLLSSVSHQNFPTFYKVDIPKRELEIEYCSGVTLQRHILENLPFAESYKDIREGYIEQILRVLKYTAGALKHLHGKRIVHRDLKPDNVVLSGKTGLDFDLKIIDFGSAIRISDEHINIPLSNLFYQAPEAEEGIIDPKSDMYSLGVVLTECFIGERVFDDIPLSAMNESAWEDYNHFQKLHGLNQAKGFYKGSKFENVIEDISYKMIEPEPQKRISSDELISELEKAIE